MSNGVRVYGYHGTSVTAATAILQDRSAIQFSRQRWDWLGDGVYFWHDARIRAWDWARNPPHAPPRHDPAVLVGLIRLEDCMELLDIAWGDYLRAVSSTLLNEWQRRGRKLPAQTPWQHPLDRLVVNRAVEDARKRGVPVRVVRAAFVEGEPSHPTSYLFDRAHVQIAVRDRTLIEDLWLDTPS